MTSNSNGRASAWGMATEGFMCILILAGKASLLLRAGASIGQCVAGILPELLIVLVVFGAYVLIAGFRRPWVRRSGETVVILVTLAICVFTIVAAIGFWKTGSIPRLQQFRGLTWAIISPSVIEILHKNVWRLVAVLVAMLVLLGVLQFTLFRAPWRRIARYHWAVTGVVGLGLLGVTLFGSVSGARQYTDVIGGRFFRVDLDYAKASSDAARKVEGKFFHNYRERLKQRKGRRLADIYKKLKGSNIIYVVLESTRAKDVPLYGGPAVMPNFMAARKHMILFKHLYAQDPRSTKAYPQLDMGRFSLLSWNSYSNNIPGMFPEDGIASHLNKLGYRTYSFVDGDEFYDHHKFFQEQHGYDLVLYRQALNKGSPNANDLKMLARVKEELSKVKQPFYMMVWEIETHHPYGREYWSNKGDWLKSHPGGIKHRGAADHVRYLNALHEADDWFGRLIKTLKAEGKYENTVLIVTGDHGEAFGEHEPGNVFHGNGVYQESTHVSGFIYSPKIDGLYTDDRNLRLVDMPATILDLASDKQYLLNAGRSIFYNYKYAMPIYLFNSWAGAIGIIYDGYKLWHREAPGSPLFFASMASIHADPAMERHVASGEHYQKLLKMMNTWETAMKAKTAELLVRKDKAQPPLDDVIRIYCDDGHGFRESFKNLAHFTGLSGRISIPVDKNCRSLRIAPVQSTEVPKGKYLEFNIKKLDILADDRSWNLKDVKVVWSNDLNIINNHEFKLPPGDPAFDYKLDSVNHHIKRVKMTVAFSWRHVRSASH